MVIKFATGSLVICSLDFSRKGKTSLTHIGFCICKDSVPRILTEPLLELVAKKKCIGLCTEKPSKNETVLEDCCLTLFCSRFASFWAPLRVAGKVVFSPLSHTLLKASHLLFSFFFSSFFLEFKNKSDLRQRL